jgi:hypothetical protein
MADERAKREPEIFAHNGAAVLWLAYPWQRWSVVDCHGHHHGLRASLEAARELAASLPGEPPAPPPVPRPDRSPRASFPQEPGRMPPGVPREERRDFDFDAPPQGAPVIPQRDPFAENRAMSRRQASAHARVYGRNK